MRPAHLTIDLSAITHNLRTVRHLVGPEVRIIAVVKADAYGHGMLPVARTALAAGAEMLAVALVEEGIALRQAGVMAPVLVMGSCLPEQAAEIVGWGITPTVMSQEQALALAQAAQQVGATLPVHLKVDTGMCRLGCRVDDLHDFCHDLAGYGGLVWEGIYSHLADPTEGPEATRQQGECFVAAIDLAQEHLGPLPYRHLSSSGGICLWPELHLTAVRPGEMMYGLVAGVPEERMPDLREAMSLQTRIAFLKRALPGERVSYGGTYEVPAETVLAVLPVGYADGYPRSLSGRAEVLVRGQRRPLVGRVCMDCLIADLGAETDCRVGDEVVIFGRQGDDEVRISQISQLAGTINQEIVARMGQRLPRVYYENGREL